MLSLASSNRIKDNKNKAICEFGQDYISAASFWLFVFLAAEVAFRFLESIMDANDKIWSLDLICSHYLVRNIQR